MNFIEPYGCLPEGCHMMTWNEVYAQFNFSPRRKELLDGLEKVLQILKQSGCEYLYLDGSFVTDKLEPNDIDACFSIKEGDDLNVIYPTILALDPILFCDHPNRLLQKAKYGCELFYEGFIADIDKSGNPVLYIDFFQQLRGYDKIKKGIVKIDIQAYDKE